MISKSPFLAVLSLCAFVGGPALASTLHFTATLDGAQAGSTTAATGFAELYLNDTQDALSMTLVVDGMGVDEMTGGHIHIGEAGVNGPIGFGFQGPVGPDNDLNGDTILSGDENGFFMSTVWDGLEGNGTTLADQLANLFSGGLYFNLHSAEFPAGELRGQILPAVSQVPLPAGAVLMLSGLGALALRARRKAA